MKTQTNLTLVCISLLLVWSCETKPTNIDSSLVLPLLQLDTGSSAGGSENTPNRPINTGDDGVWLADTVKSAPGHTGSGIGNSNNAVNGVRGAGLSGGGVDVFSLYYTLANDHIVLEWSGYKITNGPGIDFIVFENAFKVSNPSTYFMDIVIVELSNDTVNWCGFNPNYGFSPETSYSKNPADWPRFAGRNSVLFNETTKNFGYDPNLVFDTNNSGGDGFDLEELSDVSNLAGGSGCNSTLRDELKNGFTYIRLSSASSVRWKNPDTNLAFVKEAISNGPDIDGVYARYRTAR
ncbi:LIC_13355 family lipoprotein [Leptospira congkakensis]|uniref:LIC_13355 family lipoprotein n=1 Tax=Leptospira congkakensis TaxID=2484932 RepID=A0A4Z1A4L2_9LEPT|nr:LIC_13355 family lipoprotein [Leptospira congkakensis]TGL87145.1 LIC_13355 family lipoprotein [Leptospira congkakensis]TGL96713.1 LIC_13355 family lipoprotein [Leptospira congkakensis]TGL97562.1 LIC_13355 family lipoprotein [Leptospira congkakensis]